MQESLGGAYAMYWGRCPSCGRTEQALVWANQALRCVDQQACKAAMLAVTTADEPPALPDEPDPTSLNWHYRRVMILDGHDGVGKSTFAAALAVHTGAWVVRPFERWRGERLVALAGAKRWGDLQREGLLYLQQAIDNAYPHATIVDRGPLTLASLLPWGWPGPVDHVQWRGLLAKTILLDADVATIRGRLLRDGAPHAEIEQDHEGWRSTYRLLANRWQCEIVGTTEGPDFPRSRDVLDHLLRCWAVGQRGDG